MTPQQQNAETAELWALPRLGAERRAAIRDVGIAFWTSRLAVWASAVAAVLVFGWFPETTSRLDPFFTTVPFEDDLANLLVAPGARFDAAWYLAIADHGYGVSGRAAFFPLFPALTAAAGDALGSALIGGMLISTACGLGGLYLLHRLVAFDYGREVARSTVWIVSWLPSALVLSAVYTEGLFLLCSVGSLYAGRLGRWRTAGVLGGLAAASRSGGLLLIVPLLILYFCGPRADRPGAHLGPPRVRFAPRADVLWIVAGVPAGLLAYVTYLGLATGDPTAAFSAQELWNRSFVPLGGIALGVWSAASGIAREALPGLVPARGAIAHGVDPAILTLRDVVLCASMLSGFWLLAETARRLPLAYSAYAFTGMALPLSVPAAGHALMSLPRFMFVLFPLWIALALWAHERGRVRTVLMVLGPLLVACSALFATWSWAP